MFELDKLITNGMTEKDFLATRNFLINYVPQMVSSQDKQLGYALDSEYYNTTDFVNYVRNQLKSLTVADINRVIKQNLQSEDIQFVFISGDAKDMEKRLLTESRSTLKYNSDKPADLLADDKIIQDYKLSIPKKNLEIVPVKDIFK